MSELYLGDTDLLATQCSVHQPDSQRLVIVQDNRNGRVWTVGAYYSKPDHVWRDWVTHQRLELSERAIWAESFYSAV